MNIRFFSAFLLAVAITACSSILSPPGWPVLMKAEKKSVSQMIEYVKFSGSIEDLTQQEKVLLTFLADPQNVAAAISKKNIKGEHQWAAAEIYIVEPGKHVSVLCENGYEQKAVYFHFNETAATWYRVGNLEPKHSKGIPAIGVQ